MLKSTSFGIPIAVIGAVTIPRSTTIFATTSSPPFNTSMPHTVIIGAGIIGVSTAYFLSHAPNRQPDHKITVLDPCPPASGASGKAGGFIARNWAGAATASLAELSFRLHDELAQQHGGAENWGYRRCRAVSVVGRNARGNPMGDLTRSVRLKNVEKMDSVGALEWIKPGVIQDQNLLGDNDAIAQWYKHLNCMYD